MMEKLELNPDKAPIDMFSGKVSAIATSYQQLPIGDRDKALKQLRNLLSRFEQELANQHATCASYLVPKVTYQTSQVGSLEDGKHDSGTNQPKTNLPCGSDSLPGSDNLGAQHESTISSECEGKGRQLTDCSSEHLLKLHTELASLRKENTNLRQQLQKLEFRDHSQDVSLQERGTSDQKPAGSVLNNMTGFAGPEESVSQVVKRKRGRPRKKLIDTPDQGRQNCAESINNQSCASPSKEIKRKNQDLLKQSSDKQESVSKRLRSTRSKQVLENGAASNHSLNVRRTSCTAGQAKPTFIEEVPETGHAEKNCNPNTDPDPDPEGNKHLTESKGLVKDLTLLGEEVKRKRGRPRKHPIHRVSKLPMSRHKRIVRHVCKLCKMQFLHGRPFNRHLVMRHEKGPVCCRQCKREFVNEAVFCHHRCEAEHNKKGMARPCSCCQEMFTNCKKLQQHMKTVHGVVRNGPEYFCRFCQKGFVRKPSLILHYKEHAGDQLVCDRCGEFLRDDEEYANHLDQHEKNAVFRCDRCGAMFERRQQYEQHLTGHEKYDCSICNEVFSRKKQLLKHFRILHGIKISVEDKKYECDECKRKFSRPGQLEIHKRMHTGERPIECEVCKMFFRTSKALAKHRQTHTHLVRAGDVAKDRNHLCSVCGKAYFRKQALQRHMRYHTDDKPFPCPHCAYSCRENNNLKRHIALHFSTRNFVCETCGAAFHAKKTLETHHLYKHSNTRSFPCKDCPMSFKTVNSLRRHARVHQNARPYKCPQCHIGFNRLYNLRRHMKAVHGTDQPLPPVNRVKLLDAPEGQEFAKGPAALGLQGKPLSIAEMKALKEEASAINEEATRPECSQMQLPTGISQNMPQNMPPQDMPQPQVMPQAPLGMAKVHVQASQAQMFVAHNLAAYSTIDTQGTSQHLGLTTLNNPQLTAQFLPQTNSQHHFTQLMQASSASQSHAEDQQPDRMHFHTDVYSSVGNILHLMQGAPQ